MTAGPVELQQGEEEVLLGALRAGDARYDGLFFAGVMTTGVYCRPVCRTPRPPKRENLRIFGSAADAEAAGLRPCRRCHPERAPGVSSPAHLAHRLLAETDLSLAEVGAAAGYASDEEMEGALRSVFRRGAGEVRRRSLAAPDGWVALSLSYRPPFDWDALLAYLAARGTPGVEEVSDGAWIRGDVRVTDGPGDSLLLAVPRSAAARIREIEARVRFAFDLDADPMAIGSALGESSVLAPLVAESPGLRVPRAWDVFEVAVRAILGQQISVPAATTLAGRLVRAYGGRVERRAYGGEVAGSRDGSLRAFPDPASLVDADLRAIGCTGSQERAIRALAAAVASGSPLLAAPRGLDDFVARMCELPGIGPWTAQYVAMRGLGEPDAFPAGDLGLRRALGGVTERELRAMAEEWRPWRAYAAMHLWAAGAR